MPVTSTKHFTERELSCRCGKCEPGMDAAFMAKVEALREAWGKPIRVNSAYRCPTHNRVVSATGMDGPHTTRRAMDISVARGEAFALLGLAMSFGAFTGIGLKQKGLERFIHLDDLRDDETTGPRPTVWTY